MRKHTKAGLVLLMAGMMMAGSVTSAFADTEATAATSGVIDTTKKNAETGGPGSTAASTENTLDGHTYSTEAPGSNTSQTQASTSAPETSASAESSQDATSGQDNALTQDQANRCRGRSRGQPYRPTLRSVTPAASDHCDPIQ